MFIEAGLPPSAALQAATINNAVMLQQDSLLGSIEPGKLADLVILSADPITDIRNVKRIEKVIRGGRLCEPAAHEAGADGMIIAALGAAKAPQFSGVEGGRFSPPGEIRIGSGPSVVPLISTIWKLEVVGMAVAPQHIKAVFSFVVVPLAPWILLVAVGIPRPVALDNLVGWAAGDLAHFDRLGLRTAFRGNGVARHVFHSNRLERPHREVTIAPRLEGTADALRPNRSEKRIAFVARTVEHFYGGYVLGQRPPAGRHASAVEVTQATHAAGRSTQAAPLLISRIGVRVVVRIHAQTDGDLVVVAVALDPLRFCFGPRQGRQQHAGQNCDDGDDDKEFDQREGQV